ncbi:hypothetical protein FP2506_09951 [Fulvimarina pelagi HTCC2506]|uniref:Uncharacterized protein n=1 Tax=Fulvimarina pelagi HTCC2506 TaxID=314231 RepID=Q0G5A6_9HYPH|nr:hypothetical protein FP2506_09951 [Fulvimarina pelagi HTCC2506]
MGTSAFFAFLFLGSDVFASTMGDAFRLPFRGNETYAGLRKPDIEDC